MQPFPRQELLTKSCTRKKSVSWSSYWPYVHDTSFTRRTESNDANRRNTNVQCAVERQLYPSKNFEVSAIFHFRLFIFRNSGCFFFNLIRVMCQRYRHICFLTVFKVNIFSMHFKSNINEKRFKWIWLRWLATHSSRTISNDHTW